MFHSTLPTRCTASASFLASAEHARGEVLEVRTVSHSGRHRSHSTHLDVGFQDAQGASHRFAESVQDPFSLWHPHDRVDVAYPRGLPGLARVGGFENQWFTPFFFLLGGLAMFGWGWSGARQPQS